MGLKVSHTFREAPRRPESLMEARQILRKALARAIARQAKREGAA